MSLCHQLARHSTHISVSTSEGRQFDSLLRYFTTDSAYVDYLENGDWKAGYDRFVDTNISASPARSLFTTDIPQGKLRKLTLDMYGVLQSLPAARLEWQPEIWFSLPEYRACWEAANLKHYYQRSVSEYSSVAAAASSALLDDIIRTNDAAAAGKTDGKVAALRFGHAETVIPLFALMRLPGCYYPEGSAESVASEWKDWEVSPLGANLMIVMLKDRVGDTFVSLRLNGRWLTITSPRRQLQRQDNTMVRTPQTMAPIHPYLALTSMPLVIPPQSTRRSQRFFNFFSRSSWCNNRKEHKGHGDCSVKLLPKSHLAACRA